MKQMIATQKQSLIRELLKYRELVYFFVWRYFKVRYKQTTLGILWVIIQPLFLTAVVSIFILRGLKIDFGYTDVMAIIPIYAGFAMWSYFDKTVNGATDSLVSNRNIMTKVYFPKIIPPLAVTISGLIDLIFALAIFFVLVLVSGSTMYLLGIATMFLAVVVAVVAAFGLGTLFAALNIEYRDISQFIPFLLRIGVFATPVFYPISLLPESLQPFAFLNPMTGVIELFRDGFFDPSLIPWSRVSISIVSAVILLAIGLLLFRRKEKNMIDVI